MTKVWTQWEGQVINGVFPLRRILSASDYGAIFLTEYKARNLPAAALKLVPAIPTLTQPQLSHWATTAALSHPHLIRLFEMGRCQLEDLQFLFVVMEYAEQTLSQILPRRALTPDEAREMLLPTLNALAFLHGKDLVQGRLKPSNVLVVNDQLKLASDTVRPAGESTAYIANSSVYDPPEAKDGGFSAAGDIWCLGMTMVEALTQHPPSWPDGNFQTPSFPAALPAAFVEIARQCLNRDPEKRPTVAGLQNLLEPAPQSSVVSLPEPPFSLPEPPARPRPAASIPRSPLREARDRLTPPEAWPKRRLFVPAIAALLVVAAAVWVGLHEHGSRPSSERTAPSTAALQNRETSPPAHTEVSASRPSDLPEPPPANESAGVLHEEIPYVPSHARNTIRGRIKVAIRVTVDRSGNVVAETLENPGPSKYFARLAATAARKWKFAPAGDQDSRRWLLRFEFSRGGATAHAARAS